MNLAYHHAKFADLYEETIYNALLGSVDLDAKNFYYDNPLVEDKPRSAAAYGVENFSRYSSISSAK